MIKFIQERRLTTWVGTNQTKKYFKKVFLAIYVDFVDKIELDHTVSDMETFHLWVSDRLIEHQSPDYLGYPNSYDPRWSVDSISMWKIRLKDFTVAI